MTTTDIQVYPPSTGFTLEQQAALREKLDGNLIYHRDGQGGKKLAYIKGSTAIAHANEIFGYGQWGYRLLRQEVRKSYDLEEKVTGLYFETDIELFVTGAAFPVTGCGAAAIEKPYGPIQYENARKSSVKDAIKLALVNFGDQFGLALYDADAEVELNGEMVPVRSVPINDGSKPASKRIVDSQPPARPQKPAPYPLEKEVVEVKKQVKAAGIANDVNGWLSWKCSVLQAVVSDNDLTLEHIELLKQAVEESMAQAV